MGTTTSACPAVYPVIVPTTSSLQSFNFYLVHTRDALILVDAGVDTEKCWNRLKDVLNVNGWKLKDLDKIILTHNHHDHIGLVNRIRSISNIPVYAHSEAIPRLKRDQQFMHTRIAFFQSLYAEMGCGTEGENRVRKLKQAIKKNKDKVVHGDIWTVKEGDIIEGFQVVEVPGHAPDHIALFHPESGIFLGGDHLIKHVSSNALIEPDQYGRKISSLLQYENSLGKCQHYPLKVVYPGHGEIVNNPMKLIEDRIRGIERKSEKIRRIIQGRSCTAAEVAQDFYKEKYECEFSLVMSEVIGHLDRLISLNKITKEHCENRACYQSASPIGTDPINR